MNHRCQYALIALILSISFLSSYSFAAGPTDEEEAIERLDRGHLPMAISQNGEWLLYINKGNVLVRENLRDKKRQILKLKTVVLSLATSQTGKKVVIADTYGCIGIIDFPEMETEGKTTKTEWINRTLEKEKKCPATEIYPIDQGRDWDDPYARSSQVIVISSDGKKMAFFDNEAHYDPKAYYNIEIIDIASKKITQKIHQLNTVRHLRFIDENRKLLIANAILGEQYESASLKSDMQFIVWDLQNKEVFNFYHTDTKGNLGVYDFLFDYHEKTGILWAINANGRNWKYDEKGQQTEEWEKIRPYQVNLKEPNPKKNFYLAFTPSGFQSWRGFVADPKGHWVAYSELRNDERSSDLKPILRVYDSQTGKPLAEWALDRPLFNLVATPDGKSILGRPGNIDAIQHVYDTDKKTTYPGTEDVQRFDLPEKALKRASSITLPWPDERLLIEDEEPEARNISQSKQRLVRKLEIELVLQPLASEIEANASKKEGVNFRNCFDEYRNAYNLEEDAFLWNQIFPKYEKAWFPTEEGVWVDRLSSLERISLKTGKVLETVPTPRSEKACTLPLYDKKLFLSWQGDTVSLRPFAQQLSNDQRTVLAYQPGWKAEIVVWLGVDRFGVRWKKNLDTSILATVHDLSGKQLAEIKGKKQMNSEHYSFEEEDGEMDMPYAVFRSYLQAEGKRETYHWEQSYLGSIRSQERDAAGGTKTILWAGLRVGEPEIKRPINKVINLGYGLGASISPSGIQIFDAKSKQVYFIPQEGVIDVGWSDKESSLFIVIADEYKRFIHASSLNRAF